MDKYLFHSNSVNLFRDKIYKDIYTIWDISSDEKRIKDSVDSSIVYDGFEMKDRKTKKTLFLKSSYNLNGQRRGITNAMPIKVLNTKKIVYSRKIYHLITDWKSVKFEPSDEISFKNFFDSWFPIEHTNEDDKLVAKFLILASATSRSFSRIVTGAGFGKDGIADNLINITGKGRNVGTASPAKLFQLISDDFTVFNELAGFGGEKREIMQKFFLETGDASKNIYEHGTTGSDKTNSQADISNYGWCIFHNLPEYYIEKGQSTFEQMFTPAVFDRIFPVLLEGRVCSNNSFININKDFDKLVNDNIKSYANWIGKFYSIKDKMKKEFVKYKLDKYKLGADSREESSSRFYNSFYRIAKLVQMYNSDETQFYKIMDIIYDRHKKYIKKVTELGLI